MTTKAPPDELVLVYPKPAGNEVDVGPGSEGGVNSSNRSPR